jgi:hydrogenase maturation factor
MAREKGEEPGNVFGEEFMRSCRKLAEELRISVLEDARTAVRKGRIHSMHDPTEGGLANALREVTTAANVGLVVDEDRIPILEECKVLCNHYGLDPLGLIASGCLLVMVESSDSEKVMRSLGKAGIPAEKIGEIAQKEQGVKIRSEQRLKDVPMFAWDEIARVLEKA